MSEVIYNQTYLSDLETALKSIPRIESLRNKTTIVTGSTGMIGSAIVDCLMAANVTNKLNIKIIAGVRNIDKGLKRFAHWNDNSLLKFIKYDTKTGIENNERADYIIHAAGYASPNLYVSNPVEVMESNFIGMYNLLDYAQKTNVEKLIYLSSSEVYGAKTTTEPWREDMQGSLDLLAFRSCYASSKRATETLCSAYMKEYSVNTVIARPGHIYGPTALSSDTKASTQCAALAKINENIVLKSKGDQIRSYCYMLDCASAIITLLICGENGEAYNISNPNSIASIRQLAEGFAEASGVEVIFSNPTDKEKEAFNPMDNSSLNSEKLIGLGWHGAFDLMLGVRHTLKGIY